MDYIDYELNRYYEAERISDEMERLGFDDEDKYIDYLADLEADAQEAQIEAFAEY